MAAISENADQMSVNILFIFFSPLKIITKSVYTLSKKMSTMNINYIIVSHRVA